jgi:plastocyanin
VRFSASIAVALMVAAGAACDSTTTIPVTTKSVTVGDNFFAPETDTVSVGDSVLFVWQGNAAHDVLGSGGTWCGTRTTGLCSVKFTMSGSFPYYCHWHAGMQGTIEVR